MSRRASHVQSRSDVVNRRQFLGLALSVGAIGGAAVFLGTRPAERELPRGSESLESISGLVLHFDAARAAESIAVSEDFASRGWRDGHRGSDQQPHTTGSVDFTDEGLGMAAGTSADVWFPLAANVENFAVDVRVLVPRSASTHVALMLRYDTGATSEVRLAGGADGPLVVSSSDGSQLPVSVNASDASGDWTVRFTSDGQRVVVDVNGRAVLHVNVDRGHTLSAYGVRFTGGDLSTRIRSVVVRDVGSGTAQLNARVRTIAQLVQPSPWLAAWQHDISRQPMLTGGAIGDQAAMMFDGRSTSLESNVPVNDVVFTLVAVARCRSGTSGTIVGSSNPAGGFQMRFNDDKSVEILDAGQATIVRTPAGTFTDSGAIVICSIDSTGTVAVMVNGALASTINATPVSFASDSSMIVGATIAGEHFDGAIGEIFRWHRPLSGLEMRDVFERLGRKWTIDVAYRSARSASPKLPTVVKGSNIIPSPADMGDANRSPWRNLWRNWDWKWLSGSVRQAASLGSTSIRIIGDTDAVYSKQISLDTYLHRLSQLLDACAQSNCTLYYCLIDLRHKGGADVEFIEQFAGSVGSVLSKHQNVMAVDLCNEVAAAYPLYSRPAVIDWITRWSSAMRRSAPEIPQSISDVVGGSIIDNMSNLDRYRDYRTIVDFFDMHVYQDFPITPDARPLAPYELEIGLPLVIGEFGADRTAAGSQPAQFYKKVRMLCDSSALVPGALQWGAVDAQFGLFTDIGARPMPDWQVPDNRSSRS